MPLPEVIEIVPLDSPLSALVTVPGSKSITNRALVLAALADGPVTLRGALWSEDTQIMVSALRQLGFDIDLQADEKETCNRTIRVGGLGGRIPNNGTAEKPLALFVGNAGTAARFLAALTCLGRGAYRLHGSDRMHERPQAALFAALRALGYRIDSAQDRLPADIHGAGPHTARCRVDMSDSSQFASALLLCASVGGWTVDLAGDSEEEAPYVAMTRQLISAFPRKGGEFEIEADASSASYFYAANWLLQPAATVSVASFPKSDWQIDAAFPRYLPLPPEVSRRGQLGDSIMTAIVVAPFANGPTRFRDLERLRVQECERVAALRTELTKCGVVVVEKNDDLTIFPAKGALHGAEIETYNDHRMAMCFAILGLKIKGIRIKNPSCVKKTFPNFFQKLAGPSPSGLGASVRDARTAQALREAELFAD
ncbi:MAG TPA: 3-phosphoshikimate 1-carboxyvinyltransferase [Verrucomicrobiae bacterium]|jgi:3-phosphoshikimate 1-carboxyvinyltransferase|nr:3-phosphoshikimate 1-carboxyvinyltransferase [Verrucomicrobiae bacterium]